MRSRFCAGLSGSTETMLSTSATDGRAWRAATFARTSSRELATISSNRTDRFVCSATR